MADFRIFNYETSDIKLGSKQVSAVYFREQRVWPSKFEKEYFTLKMNEDSVIKNTRGGYQYSLDDGDTWYPLNANVGVPVAKGKKILFKGNMVATTGGDPYGIGSFSGSTGSFTAEGNVMSLIFNDDFESQTSLASKGSFALSSIFKGCKCLTSAKNLSLPATTLSTQCYYAMFWGCSNLTEAPKLPSPTLASLCYQEMFRECTSLEKAPELLVETPSNQCYHQMFYGCTNLNEVTCMLTGSTTAHTANWLSGVAEYGTFHKNEEKATSWKRGISGVPLKWCIPELKDYFAIKAIEDSVVKFSYREDSFYYSLDEGLTWNAYTTANAPIELAAGERVLWQTQYGGGSGTVYSFSATTGNIEAEGNIMSFVYGDNYENQAAHKTGAYRYMFANCTALTSCENVVFTDAAIGDRSCDCMFSGCTNLEKVPSILPTSTNVYSYCQMFKGCSKLKNVPELPATTLSNYCYQGIFADCTSLEKSPVLPAEKLATGSYLAMFSGCTSLNEIWCYASDINASSGLDNWVKNVAPTGIFHRYSGNTQWTINSVNGVPIGWELDPPLGYFTFVANEPSVVQFSKSGLSGSTDSGATWFALGTSPFPLNTGEELWLKSNITPSTSSPYGMGNFSASTGNLTAKGNIQSLNYADTMSGPVKARSYSHLFESCSAITDCEDLILPNTVAEACYDYMFYNATNLVKAPKILPATALTTSCYQGMFINCTSLEKSPILPAETLSNNCYGHMFSGCTSLREVTCYGTNQNNSTANTQNWLAGVSPTGVFYKNMDKITTWGSRGVNGIPIAWKVDGLDDYITFKANEASTIKFNKDLNYSVDSGETWAFLAANGTVELQPGETVMYEGNWSPDSSNGIGSFSASTGNFEVYGNSLSLTYGDNYNLQTTLKGTYQFLNLFTNCSGLTSVKNLTLLDATTTHCYKSMFKDCVNLVEVPSTLPATALSQNCYENMFCGCTSLTTIPEGLLPAMTMAADSYNWMFNGCTSLTTPPELPATTLASKCYYGMFSNCTSLEKSPVLSATTLVSRCYETMFSGCTSLNEIWCYATSGINANSATTNWVYNVSPTGTFHKSEEVDSGWSINSANGIPVGWTPDPMPNYFTVVAVEDSNIKMNRSGFSGSTDGGYTWFAMGTSGTPLAAGEELMMVCTNGPNTGTTPYGVGGFTNSTGNFAVKGNIMSLRYGFNFEGRNNIDESCFRTMFQSCTAITDAYDLEMPATVFTGGNQHCRMFERCTNLKRGPKILPSTGESGSYLYEYMFLGCTALEESPIIMLKSAVNSGTLHATFSGCTSLSAITCYATNVSTAQCVDFSQGVAAKGVFTKERREKTNWVRGKEGIPYTWCAKDVEGYFELEAITDCVFKNSKSPYYYSVDSGETWTLLPTSGVEITAGDSVLFNAQIIGGTSSPYGIGTWSGSTGTFNAKGNALSLSKCDNFELDTNLVRSFELGNIFTNCTGLISAKDLKLPSMSLYQQCYYAMFWGCPNLIEAPELPALTLSALCYQEMFRECTSLEKAPVLPAETPVDRCYYGMFSGCTSLNEIWCSLTGNAETHTSGWTTSVAEYGTFHKNEEKATNWTRGVHGIPTKWGAGDPEKYLTIEAIEASTIKFTNSICRSLDNGESWETLAANTATELAPGEKALYGGILGAKTDAEPYGVGTFSASTGNFKAYGPVLAMTWMDNSEQAIRSDHNFSSMFRNCPAIIDAEGIILPPVLNKNHVCYAMFAGCPNLKKVPKLTSDITKGGQTQYQRMFMNSTGLEEVPEDMLPAETLTAQCYYGMFSGCTSLVKAPLLPAKVLPSECYYQMFNGCTSLNEIWCSGTTYNSNCCYNWTLNVSPTGVFHKNLEEKTAWNRGPSGIPYTWEVDGLDDYFTIEAIDASQVRTSKNNWQYSIDGQPWSAMTAGAMIPLAAGEKMRIRSNGNIAGSTDGERGNGCFSGSTGTFKASGNIKSLCLADNYDLQPILYRDSFTNLFKGCTALTSIEDVEFPTTLVRDDFPWAFSGCTRLTKVAVLPAESATSNSHYWEMFRLCTALEEVPEDMLPSLRVGDSAYYSMFQQCTSLVKAPNLPATGLTNNSYYQMFYGCTNLNEITCMFSGATSTAYTSNWVYGVSPTGVFHKDMENVTVWHRGNYAIPITWSVADVENYLTIEAIEPSVIKHTNSWYRSTDSGVTWQEIAANVATNLEAGETVMYNANKTPVTGDPYTGIGSFSASTGVYKVYGNPKSMLYGDNFSDKTPNKYRSYQKLFLKCTGLTDASGIILPEYLEADTAYAEMFEGCTSLVAIPEYVGKDSRNEGRYAMFSGCTSLEYGPKLPAETITGTDYYRMFYGCTSLKEIWCSATTLGNNENWVYNVPSKGVFHKNMNVKTNWNRATNGIPSGWSVADNDNYFRIEAEEASTIKFSKGGLYYSVDSGETWSAYTANTAIELAAGEEVWFNGVKTPDSSEPRGIGNFSASTGVFNAKGDAMSLLYGDNIDYQTTSKSYAFQLLFMNCTGLTDASDLILTAETLSSTDFYAMFSGCTSLVLPPKELPAKVISTYGYSHMFMGCTSLTKAPYIAATGYSGSFNCSHMFSGCTSLTEVQDELHPLTIGANMYDSMFLGCSSLEKAPYLPATVVNANNCYGWMFQDCTSLKYIKCGAVTLGGTTNWVNGVGSEGVFYKSPAASWSTGVSAIPSGWEVKLMSEDE